MTILVKRETLEEEDDLEGRGRRSSKCTKGEGRSTSEALTV